MVSRKWIYWLLIEERWVCNALFVIKLLALCLYISRCHSFFLRAISAAVIGVAVAAVGLLARTTLLSSVTST